MRGCLKLLKKKIKMKKVENEVIRPHKQMKVEIIDKNNFKQKKGKSVKIDPSSAMRVNS